MSVWYTTAEAVSNSNRDGFERNIVSYRGGGGAVVAKDSFDTPSDPGGPLMDWPGYEHARDWALSQDHARSTTHDEAHTGPLGRAVAAANQHIAHRVGYKLDQKIPADLHLAASMQAAKWYFRKDSPNGVVGSDALSGAIRAGKFDPDVELILERYDQLGLG